jgi:hypothetical protein
MTDIPFPLLVAFTFLFGCLAMLQLYRRQQDAQRSLPQRAEYLAVHAQQTPACSRCGAQETRDFGLHDGEDHRRVVACAKCDRLMYQYSREPAAID